MYEHMINWKLVVRDQASITPKNESSVFIYIGLPTDTFLSVKGDRESLTQPIDYYSRKLIPIYGF